MDTFSQIRTFPGEPFPFPEHGETVLENPPSLVWLPDNENDGKGYRVVIKDENGFEKTFFTPKSYFTLPEALTPGMYTEELLYEIYSNTYIFFCK